MSKLDDSAEALQVELRTKAREAEQAIADAVANASPKDEEGSPKWGEMRARKLIAHLQLLTRAEALAVVGAYYDEAEG